MIDSANKHTQAPSSWFMLGEIEVKQIKYSSQS